MSAYMHARSEVCIQSKDRYRVVNNFSPGPGGTTVYKQNHFERCVTTWTSLKPEFCSSIAP